MLATRDADGHVVGVHAVLAVVQPFDFLFLGNADAHDGLDRQEEDGRCYQGKGGVGTDTSQLLSNGVLWVVGEDTDGQGAPDTTDQVNRDGANGVVNLQLVEEQDRGDNQTTSNDADGNGWKGLIESAPAVMPTKPAKMPFRAMDRSGLLDTKE